METKFDIKFAGKVFPIQFVSGHRVNVIKDHVLNTTS